MSHPQLGLTELPQKLAITKQANNYSSAKIQDTLNF